MEIIFMKSFRDFMMRVSAEMRIMKEQTGVNWIDF